MIAGPHGKIYVGGYPDYGLRGGAISVYDLKRVEKRTYRHLIQNQSIVSLAYIPHLDLIVAGSSVRGGTGTRAIEKEAKLILWSQKRNGRLLRSSLFQGESHPFPCGHGRRNRLWSYRSWEGFLL